MILEAKTDLSEAAVMEKAMVYFAGGLNMSVISETANAISFESGEGTVNVTAREGSRSIQVIAEGLEDRARDFAKGLSEAGGESVQAPGL